MILAALVAYSAGNDDLARREEACRDNNIGVALLEQFHPEEAAPRFRRALEVDPGLAVAQVNLAVALLNVPDLEGAQKEAAKAAERLPDSLHARYVLGLVAKSENRVDDAIAAFSQVLAKDPLDVGAHVNRGQLHLQARRYEEAIADFREALAAEPYNGTALYNLGLALTRAGRREEGQKALESFQELRDKGYGTSIGTAYGEQGRYASAVATTGAEPERVDAEGPGCEVRAGGGAGGIGRRGCDLRPAGASRSSTWTGTAALTSPTAARKERGSIGMSTALSRTPPGSRASAPERPPSVSWPPTTTTTGRSTSSSCERRARRSCTTTAGVSRT